MTADEVKAALLAHSVPASTEVLGRFFKTGKGQYAEGDVLLVCECRIPGVYGVSSANFLLRE